MEMKVDEINHTFEFKEKDLTADSVYLLRYLRMNGIMETIGSGTTNAKGTLKIDGDYRAPLEDIHSEFPPKYELIDLTVQKAEADAKEKDRKKEERKIARADAKRKKADNESKDTKKKESDTESKDTKKKESDSKPKDTKHKDTPKKKEVDTKHKDTPKNTEREDWGYSWPAKRD